jgi:hypothetical protein
MSKPKDIETCETCVYRVQRDVRSFCFRYPKQAIIWESNTPRRDDHPQVIPATDWCGEWEGDDKP